MNPLRVTLLSLALAPHALAQDDVEIEVGPSVAPPAEPAAPPSPPPAPPPAPPPDLTPQLDALRAELEAVRAQIAAAAPAPAPEPHWTEKLDLRVTGYVQPQLVSSQLSEDEVSVEGEPLNEDRFLIRRGRLKVERTWRYAHAALEVDVNTNNGPAVGVSEAALAARLPRSEAGLPPLALVQAGLFDIPFGGELPQGSRNRFFMERTLGSRALFPGENDVGVRLAGAFGPLRASVAALNGVPLSTSGSGGGDVETASKTLVARMGVDAASEERWTLTGGVSWLSGTALHAGTPETKSSLLWSDSNQNGLVTLDELVGVNGQSATPSATFSQWAVNGDLAVGLHTPLGWTRVFAEATLASNLDRGYYPADPVSTGYDLRELAWSAGVVQELFRYGLVGFRADDYDPNADAFASRRGVYTTADLSVLTLAPALGVQYPGLGRLVLQYDYVVDQLGVDAVGEPRDLANDQWTLRAQVEF